MSSISWYNHWFKISKFITQRQSNSPASSYKFVRCFLNCNFTNVQLVRDKSQKYILLGQLKKFKANFEWSVPLSVQELIYTVLSKQPTNWAHLERSVVTMKLCTDYLNTVTYNTSLILWIKNEQFDILNAILCQHIRELQTVRKQSGLAQPVLPRTPEMADIPEHVQLLNLYCHTLGHRTCITVRATHSDTWA